MAGHLLTSTRADPFFAFQATASRTDIPVDIANELKTVTDRMSAAVKRASGLARLVVTSGEFRELVAEAWAIVTEAWVGESVYT